MLRFLLQPRWWAWHAGLAAVLVAFASLGWWQLTSFEAADRDETTSRPPVAIESVTRPGGRLTSEELGRAVTAEGTYDARHQLVVPSRPLGGRDGYLLVTPLRTADGIVPVARGWVRQASGPAARVPAGPVTVTGVLQPSESQDDSRLDPLEPLPPGQIPFVATVLMLDALPYSPDELYDGYVVLTAQQPAASPGPQRIEPRGAGGVAAWRNLAYALQWWLFGAAAVFFWWSVIRRASRDAQGDDREVAQV